MILRFAVYFFVSILWTALSYPTYGGEIGRTDAASTVYRDYENGFRIEIPSGMVSASVPKGLKRTKFNAVDKVYGDIAGKVSVSAMENTDPSVGPESLTIKTVDKTLQEELYGIEGAKVINKGLSWLSGQKAVDFEYQYVFKSGNAAIPVHVRKISTIRKSKLLQVTCLSHQKHWKEFSDRCALAVATFGYLD